MLFVNLCKYSIVQLSFLIRSILKTFLNLVRTDLIQSYVILTSLISSGIIKNAGISFVILKIGENRS